jgi:hypothetical protein
MTTLRPEYVVEEKTISLQDIQNDVLIPSTHPRKIRWGVVREIAEQMENGQHFNSPLCVNKRQGKHHLFDGHHRLEALRRYLTAHLSHKVVVTLHVFDNLTDAQVKEEYKLVNRGTKQSTNDLVSQYEDELQAFQLMQNGWNERGGHKTFACPVTAYPSPASLSFYNLAGAYMACREQNFTGGYTKPAEDFIQDAMQLGIDDVKLMHAFLLDFDAAFGQVKNNDFVKGTRFTALLRLWMDNRVNIPQGTLVRLFKDRICANPQALQMSRGGGTKATLLAHQFFMTMLNAGRRQNQFMLRQ